MPFGEQAANRSDRIDKLIANINGQHLRKARLVRGKDINDHFLQMNEWEDNKQWDELLALIEEIIPVTHTLVQYDQREPQSYWPMKAATIHLRQKRPDTAVRLLSEWLEAWPASRGYQNDRKRVRERIAKIMNRYFQSTVDTVND